MSSRYLTTTPVASSVPFDNSTDGFTATDVQAAIEEAGHKLTVIQLSDSTLNTTTLATFSAMTGMSTTPAAGTYLVTFNTSVSSPTAGAIASFAIYVGGTQDAGSVSRAAPLDGGVGATPPAIGNVTCIGTAVVNGSQAIAAQWASSSGTMTITVKRMTLLRIA